MNDGALMRMHHLCVVQQLHSQQMMRVSLQALTLAVAQFACWPRQTHVDNVQSVGTALHTFTRPPPQPRHVKYYPRYFPIIRFPRIGRAAAVCGIVRGAKIVGGMHYLLHMS